MRSFPIDTGHKLNVLCAFNLRAVSKGLLLMDQNKTNKMKVWTEILIKSLNKTNLNVDLLTTQNKLQIKSLLWLIFQLTGGIKII